MSDPIMRSHCKGFTQSGQPCKNYALPGSDYCRLHGRAEGLKTSAELELDVETEAAGSEAERASEAERGSETERERKDFGRETPAGIGFISGVGSDGSGEFQPEPLLVEAEVPYEELRVQLLRELDRLIERLKRMAPEYQPPPFSPRRWLELIGQNLGRFTPEIRIGLVDRLRSSLSSDLFDLDTWKGIWYMLNYTVDYPVDIVKRRMSGEYETDEWGLDMEFLQTILPFFRFMYKKYWRVQTSGIENIPETGRALLVSNHSGQLPWDGSMVGLAVMDEHPASRLVRTLYASWFPTLPFFSAMFTKCGQALATEENGSRLLEQDELVAVFPEGYKGVGKLFKDRYRLSRFGRGGFIRMALRTQAPIIPVSVVGAEETYISLAKVPAIARLINFPFFPISPTFPWLGPLGFVPLPTKWYIDFGELIPMDGYGPGAENNLVLVSQLTDQVRNVVQQMIYSRLEQRKSVLFG